MTEAFFDCCDISFRQSSGCTLQQSVIEREQIAADNAWRLQTGDVQVFDSGIAGPRCPCGGCNHREDAVT